MTKITVLGSGAMGTACAVLLAEHPGQTVHIWGRNPDYTCDMQTTRENRRLLPGVQLAEAITITSEIKEAVADAEMLVASIPTKALREALTEIALHIPTPLPVISVIKGMEMGTMLRPSEIISEVLGTSQVVALCGPSHAEEIACRKPASVVAAGEDVAVAERVQQLFTTDRFRVYTNPDLLGVELAGALKNVIALAAGICDGQEFGDNAKSALLTRGLVEMTRFGTKLGAEPLTFAGLAGMGDLITTCCSPHGRNRRVGERLGRGESLQEILDSMTAVAEGVTTTKSVYELATREGIDMPITEEIYQVLFEGKSPVEATDSLMHRPPRGE